MKIKNYILLIIISASLHQILIGQNIGNNLYDNSFLHQINFEAPNLMEELIDENVNSGIGYYSDPVKMTIDGIIVDSIYVRIKGHTSSLGFPIPPIKVDIDYFIPNQEYNRIDKFNLHRDNNISMGGDFYQQHSLAYQLYKRSGMPAPRNSFAEVYINGTFLGIYTITEQVDKTFLKQNFSSNNGSLVKGAMPAELLEVTVKQGTQDEYDNYINNVAADNFSSIVDVHNFFRAIGVDIIIGDGDSYANFRHNFYMYHEPECEKLHLLPWDKHFAFYSGSNSINLFPTRPIENSLFNSPTIKPLYLSTLCDLATYLLDTTFIETQTMHNFNILSSNTNGVMIESPEPLISWLINRRELLLNALATEGYSNCSQLQTPIDIGDVVINEFVAKNDENGVLEYNGESGDWIELYNTSENDIILDDKYYISDDINFPKKWHFSENHVIPADGYLTLWADRDIDQEGIHTNFKLNSKAGDLLLTYENLEVLQHVNYGMQELNKGFARIPNGSGNFVIQNHTFNSNNEIPLNSIFLNKKNSFKIYPNPSSGIIHLESTIKDQRSTKVIISDLLGKIVLERNFESTLNISGLHKGLYTILIRNNENRILANSLIMLK